MAPLFLRFPARPVRWICVVGILLGLGFCLPPTGLGQGTNDTYVVNSTSDTTDVQLGDGNCNAFVDGTIQCTLRAAIQEANQDDLTDTIVFDDIPTTQGFATITLDSAFGELDVEAEIVIDGSTAPGYPSASANGPIVKIDGSNISGDVLGFSLGADGSRVEGLAFVNGAGEGIEVAGDGAVNNVSIIDCFVGIDLDGSTVQGNLRNPGEFADNAGITIEGDGSTIDGSLVSGNSGDGIWIAGDNNTVTNSIIGLDSDGSTAKGNAGNGVTIAFGTGNSIGTAGVSDFGFVENGNTIAGNGEAGALVRGDGNDVLANLIGTNGSSAFPNSTGVVLEGPSSDNPAENNNVGAALGLAGNTISGNQFNGIRLGNGADNLAADNNSITNNFIGTGADGTSAVPNGNGSVEGGIRFDEGSSNSVEGNVIAGNNAHGIRLRGPSTSNVIRGNRIGVGANGNPLGNDFRGIWVQTNNNTIGGASSGDENIIGANSFAGILIEGSSNSVYGNFVGVNSAGADIGNEANGVAVIGGDNNGIDGNAIGNNDAAGIQLRDVAETLVQGNHVGTTASGTTAPNGNGGVLIVATSNNSASDNLVGSTQPETSEDLSSVANVIASNQGDGVRIIENGSAVDNWIRGNRIRNNTELGIDLGSDGGTANDSGDGDDGPNHFQNFPELQSTTYDPGTEEITVAYLVPADPGIEASGAAAYPLAVDFYVADADDEEGEGYLGTDTYSGVEPDDYSGCDSPPCTVTTTFTPESSVGEGDHLVATATDQGGNTSEFSPAATIGFPPQFTQTGPFDVRETATTGSVVGDVNATNGEGGAADQGVSYQIVNGNDPDEDGTNAFAMDGNDGILTVANADEIDFETREQYALQVEANDGTRTEEATVTVNVTDVAPPSVTTDPASNITLTAAQLNATVNPNQGITTVVFTYYPTSDPSATTTVTAASDLTGTEPLVTSATIGELEPGIQYGYTVEATNGEGTATGSEQTFTTEAAPPEAVTEPATEVTATSAQLNGRVTPNGPQTTATFEYFPPGQTGQLKRIEADQSPLSGSDDQSVSAVVEGLESGQTYTFQVVAENSEGTDVGEDETFTADTGQPAVGTEPATNVASSSAQLNGTVNPRGSETTASFEYFPTGQSEQEQVIPADQSPLTGAEDQSVSAVVDGLSPAQEYTFRVVGENSEGTAVGDDRTFTTVQVPAEVTTESPTNVTASSAQLNGIVNPKGIQTTVAFEYFPSGESDLLQTIEADQSPLTGTEAQTVSATVGELEPDQEYVFRVVAKNDAGSTEGAELSFVTGTPPPTVETGAATNLSARSAQLNGTVNPNDSEATALFEYYPSGQSGQAQAIEADQSPLTRGEAQSVSATVEGLDPARAYRFRVVAENAGGSAEGSEESFTTDAAPPTVETGATTDVAARSAQLTGTVDPNGLETTVAFEYFPTGQPAEAQTVAAGESPLSGVEELAVSAQAGGLKPSTEYTVRVRAENSEGSTTANDRTFTTDPAPPEATTNEATAVASTSAQLNGTITPNSEETTVLFEYSPSGQLGQVQEIEADQSPLSGTESQSVNVVVEGLDPGQEYVFRVIAENTAGTDEGDEQSFTTSTIPLTLEYSPEVPTEDTPLEVEVSGAEGFDPSEAQLFFRQTGEPDYGMTSLEETESSTFTGTVPGSAVTERGVEVYARLAAGNVVATVPESTPSEQPIHVPVQVSQLRAGVELMAEQYRMISVPLELETPDALSQLRDDFGEIDRTAWRLLRWDPGEESYEEVTTEGGQGELTPGRAYWLITRDGETQGGEETFDVEDGRSVSAEPLQYSLPPGCTQLANPRAYPIDWADVAGREAFDAASPRAYDPSAPDSLISNVETLQPWIGYWVCNTGPEAEITIPTTEAASVGGAETQAKTAQTSVPETLFGHEPAFAVQLKARLDRPQERALTDVHNVVGVADGGHSGLGTEDALEPPPISDHVRLSIVEEETQLAGSLRPLGKDGYAWDLEVTASVQDGVPGRQSVRVHLKTHGDPPPGFERQLLDRDSGRSIPIENGTFEVVLTEERPTRHLRLVVGGTDFVETESDADQSGETKVRAVYPNPSQGPVSIDYRLDTEQRVRIVVYDVLGRQVQALVDERRPAGLHTVQWDGTSDQGPVASGVYIVRLEGQSVKTSHRVSIIR